MSREMLLARLSIAGRMGLPITGPAGSELIRDGLAVRLASGFLCLTPAGFGVLFDPDPVVNLQAVPGSILTT